MADKEDIHALDTKVADLTEQRRVALARIAELEGTPPDTPAFIKATTKLRTAKKERTKRQTNAARTRQFPTVVEQHALDHCPACAYRVRGQNISRQREDRDLLDLPPVVVTAHQIIKRRCPNCATWREPALDRTGQVVGPARFGYDWRHW